MTKQEFIEKLRAALTGKISPALVAENVTYYEDYINTEIRKGRTEEEVLDVLGNPRLIAKSIIDANGGASSDAASGSQTQSGQDYQQYRDYGEGADTVQKRSAGIPLWLWVIIAIVIVTFVIGTIFSILSFLLPILMPILFVLFLVKLFRDWLN